MTGTEDPEETPESTRDTKSAQDRTPEPQSTAPRDARKKNQADWPRGPLLLSVALGALAGIGGYTYRYAEGLSYFSTDPTACVNCHIMQPQYDSWQKASHHTTAVCVDCHLPESFIPKYIAKAENGWRHGKLFTTQNFREPIEIQAAGSRILQENCVRCHGDLVHPMLAVSAPSGRSEPAGGMHCVHCHWAVGHGEKAGLGPPLRPHERNVPEAPPPPAHPSSP